MKIEDRKSVSDYLHKHDYLSNRDDGDMIEVTEWSNGEGWDINLLTKKDPQLFHLTRGQLDAINYLTKALEIEEQ